MNVVSNLVVAGLFAISAGAAGASTVTVSVNPLTDYSSLTSGWKSVSQDFEVLGAVGEREVKKLSTNVGTFTTLGGTGSGGTVTDKKGNTIVKNTGKNLALRDGNVYGRTNVFPTAGHWFLDSNDTFGMSWDVKLAGGQLFTKLIFALTDAADVGAFLRVSVDGVVKQTISKLPSGATKLIFVDFGEAIKSAQIDLGNFTTASCVKKTVKVGKKTTTTCVDTPMKNDGFSIDGIEVATVPLPAGALLLGSALAGFGLIGRRRRTAAA